ncbi:MAG: putative two component system histidine kinase, partial [Dehalococcoidia bacterium]|nr:putative two component system histidine kinase [Dehalococcoidia bacterium]
ELEQLEIAAREVYTDVREAILGLRAVTQGESDLVDALMIYMKRFTELSGVNAELVLQCNKDDLNLRPEEEVQLIRIIQEALSNVRKHAEARNARVQLGLEGETMMLVVEDDGRGFSQDRSSSRGTPQFGLQTMRERAEALGGSFSIDSAPGKGSRITVCLPRRQTQGV